jgi:hypothetical protein
VLFSRVGGGVVVVVVVVKRPVRDVDLPDPIIAEFHTPDLI